MEFGGSYPHDPTRVASVLFVNGSHVHLLFLSRRGVAGQGMRDTDRPDRALQPTDVEPKAPRSGKSLVSQDSQDEARMRLDQGLSTLPHAC